MICRPLTGAIALLMATISTPSQAFFFILPIPNLSKPPALNAIIDALEKSDETKAVAYVSEDKTFGTKTWAWGHHSGHIPQEEADRVALAKCQLTLATAKAQSVGGKPLYDFGQKTCELHSFSNKTVSARAGEWRPPQAATVPAPAPAASSASPPTTPTPAPLAAASPTTDPQPKPATVTPQPAAAIPATSSTSPQESSVAKKLRELESLRKEGLISEAEYQEKRKAILASL